jgi:hypothetical protein
VPDASDARRSWERRLRPFVVSALLVVFEDLPLQFILEELKNACDVILIDMRDISGIEFPVIVAELRQLRPHVIAHAVPHAAITQHEAFVAGLQKQAVAFVRLVDVQLHAPGSSTVISVLSVNVRASSTALTGSICP